MSATKGLGKGLDALLAAYEDEEIDSPRIRLAAESSAAAPVPTAKGAAAAEIEIALIDNNINQPRKHFDPEKLQELADSIKANGVIQPILLSKVGTRFMVVAGERRWRASKLAGLKTIPAVVREFTPVQIAEIAIVENLQRQDLNEIELARGIKKLMDEFNLTQEQVSVRLGKTRSAVAHTLRLLTLPKEVLELVETNKLSPGHARCLVTIPGRDAAISLALMCVEKGMSVRELERIVALRTSASPAAAKKPHSAELKDLARQLTSAFGTKVTISGDIRKGKIIIEYYTTNDLSRIRKVATEPDAR